MHLQARGTRREKENEKSRRGDLKNFYF